MTQNKSKFDGVDLRTSSFEIKTFEARSYSSADPTNTLNCTGSYRSAEGWPGPLKIFSHLFTLYRSKS